MKSTLVDGHLPPLQKQAAWLTVFLISLTGFASNATAIEPDDVSLKKRLQPQASVDDIARQISQQPQWRVLAAEPTVEDNKTMYRFKVLNQKRGRVQVIVVDPNEPELKQLD